MFGNEWPILSRIVAIPQQWLETPCGGLKPVECLQPYLGNRSRVEGDTRTEPIEPRSDFLDASVDQTEARNSTC
jgi:hypothetical protein